MSQQQVQVRKKKLYDQLLQDIQDIIKRERLTLLRFKHELGKRVLQYRRELMAAGLAVDEKGWTSELGELMTKLAKELGEGFAEQRLYEAVRFAEKYPDWSDFAKSDHEVQVLVGGEVETVTVKGEDLSWRQVRDNLVYPRTFEGKEQPAEQKCLFDSEECIGEVRQVGYLCGSHEASFESWLNEQKLKSTK